MNNALTRDANKATVILVLQILCAVLVLIGLAQAYGWATKTCADAGIQCHSYQPVVVIVRETR